MTETEHSSDRTEKRGAQGVPRFIVALGVVGVVALVAAVVAVVFTLSSAPAPHDAAEADAEGVSESSSGGSDSASGQVETGPNGPSAAELAAQAGGETKSEQVLSPAAEEVELQTLGAMPEQTLGLLAIPTDFVSAQFQVTFSPYGWGPGGPDGLNLVITIHSAEPVSGDTDGIGDPSGMNASVWVEPADVEAVSTGGEFTGTIEVRRQGNIGALFLLEASRS